MIVGWTTGAGPYRVYRSSSPDFYYGNHVVAETASTAATDQGGVQPGNNSYYYEVLVTTDATPPGFSANPPPLPPPVITGIAPGSGKPGDSVTISGTGFVADGSRMTVTFHGAVATITGADAISITAVVPADAYSGSVLVCIASDICSNPFPFDITYGPTFVNVSAMAFEKGTGSLWVSDRATPTGKVYEIDASDAVLDRGSLANAVLGHPSPADGNGRIYFCNASTADTNFGTIDYVESSTNSVVFFDRAGDSGGTSTPVSCAGIAASDDEPDVAYFADRRGSTIHRVVRDALVHDTQYGDQPFTFADPAGARFDSEGNLYISATTAIYKILPAEAAVELVASGFTAAAGIDLVENGGEVVLAVADKGAGKVYLISTSSPAKSLVRSGLTNPSAVAFADDPATGKTALYVAEQTRILRLADPRLDFRVKVDQRVLLSKRYAQDVYPSGDQKADRQINVAVQLNGVMDPTGKTAYFQLVDPKDPSRYIPDADDGDNGPNTTDHSLTAQAPFGADGLATATLTVDSDFSGNNYRVQAGLASGANFRPLASSPVYTTWRRGYIEHDSMFREGSWVVADSGAGQPDPGTVWVEDAGAFTPGDSAWILSGSSAATAKGELATVSGVDAGLGFVLLDHELTNLYPGSSPDSAPFSFLGRIDGDVYGATPDRSQLAVAFDDAFAEWMVLPSSGFVPTWSPVPGANAAAAGVYINARSPSFFNARLDSGTALINTVHVVSAGDEMASGLDAFLGLTQPAEGQNWSWVFDSKIATDYPGQVPAVRQFTSAHELAHQFDVDQGNTGHHDLELAWTGGQKCLMNVSDGSQFTLGVGKMHGPAGAGDNDLMCIRSHSDNLDNSAFCWQP